MRLFIYGQLITSEMVSEGVSSGFEKMFLACMFIYPKTKKMSQY